MGDQKISETFLAPVAVVIQECMHADPRATRESVFFFQGEEHPAFQELH